MLVPSNSEDGKYITILHVSQCRHGSNEPTACYYLVLHERTHYTQHCSIAFVLDLVLLLFFTDIHLPRSTASVNAWRMVAILKAGLNL